MKNSIFLIALGLILLTSCSKDDSLEQTELQLIDSIYVLNQFNETSYWDIIVLDEQERSSNNSTDITASTEGHYQPTSRDEMIITWSGIQSKNGARGRAEIIQSNPNFSFHFKLETECVMAEGDEAVFGGIITQVIEIFGNAPNIGNDWRIYFKVTDSGHAEVGNYDQIANKIIFSSPRSISLCNVYLPTDEIWSSQGYSDVVSPGYVEVRN